MSPYELRFATILLAAGASRRMGRSKALLPFGDTHLLGHATEEIAALQPTAMVAVVSPDLRAEMAEARKAGWRVVENAEPDRGQLRSLQLGLSELSSARVCGTFVLLVDNPGHVAERLAELRAAVAEAPYRAALLTHGGTPGHPVWLPSGSWRGVLKWRGPEGLRGYLAGQGPRLVESDIRDTLVDLDTPAEYERFIEQGDLTARS